MSKYRVFSVSYFPVFGLNTEIYSVNLRIQFEYRKIRTRKNSHLDTFHAVIKNRRVNTNKRTNKMMKNVDSINREVKLP